MNDCLDLDHQNVFEVESFWLCNVAIAAMLIYALRIIFSVLESIAITVSQNVIAIELSRLPYY